MKKLILLSGLLCLHAFLFAQGVAISGLVTDETGEGLPGVNVVKKGTAIGTITDINGSYQLEVEDPENSILAFSSVGYITEEFTVGNLNVINVTLTQDITRLSEIVVSAFGLQRETKSLVYARQGVETEDLIEARTNNFVQGLAGKAAGVQITSSQIPTGSNRVIIRGNNSLTGNNQPLYVVDGIPLDNPQGDQNVSVWNSGGDIDYGNPISQINASDIENIEILKGPNAAALYGSRAANGVILITTKKGTTTKGVGISFNHNTMFTQNSEYPDFQYVYGSGNAFKTAQNSNAIDKATGLPTVGSYTSAYGSPLLGYDVLGWNGEVIPYTADRDNVRDLYQVGTNYTNNISFDKAWDKSSIRISYTNTNAEWTIKDMEEQKRHNFSLKAITQIGKKLKLETTILYTNDNVRNRVYQNGSNRNPANNYMYMHPNMNTANLTPYKDEKGNAFNFTGPFHNPLWNLYENYNQDYTNRLIGNIGLTYDIVDGLNFRGRIMGDLRFVKGEEFNNMGASYDADGLYRAFDENNYNWNYEGIFNYNKTFNDFSITALLGGNLWDVSRSSRTATIGSLLLPEVASLSNAASPAEVREVDITKRIGSAFGSVSVGYRGIIYLDLTGRNDWSSTLPKENNSYFYPSAGTSFVFSELMPNNNVLSFAKLRASWAQVGSDADPYRINTTYNYGGNYQSVAWTFLGETKNNEQLKPEITTSKEIGLEAMFLENRVGFNLTYYNSSTINQIISAQVTPTTGFNAQVYNAGEITNKGWEIFLNARVLDGAFKWDIDLNYSKNESLVVSLIEGVDAFEMRRWFNVTVNAEVGQPYGTIRGNMGARDAEGHILVKSNGRVIPIANSLLGNATPDWLAGITNRFSYKGFSLSVLFDMKKGGDVYSGGMLKQTNFGIHALTLEGRDEYYMSSIILGENNNERKGVGLYGNPYVDDRVKGAIYEDSYLGVVDPDTGDWIAGEKSENYISVQPYNYDRLNSQERIVYDASYVKLREVIFGYTLPNSLLANVPFTNVRVSLVGRNLATLHRNTPWGIDPEAGTTSGNGVGIEYGSFLPTASYGFNINFSF